MFDILQHEQQWFLKVQHPTIFTTNMLRSLPVPDTFFIMSISFKKLAFSELDATPAVSTLITCMCVEINITVLDHYVEYECLKQNIT